MLQAMVIVFGFMLLGYFTQYKDEGNRSLSRLCLYYLIPVLIFQTIVKSSLSLVTVGTIVIHFFLTTIVVYYVLTGVIGRVVKWEGTSLKWNSLSSTLANVGYFGLAVIQFGVGKDAVPYAVAVALAFNLYMAFIGFSQVGNEAGWKDRTRTLLKNPYLFAVAVSLVWKYFGFQMPAVFDHLLDFIEQATLPLTLLLTGAELRRNRFTMGSMKEAFQISMVKLILPVLLAWPLAYLLTSSPIERMVMILMFGMPTSLNLLLLAKDQNQDTAVISMAILLTTILSPLTLIGLMKLMAGT